MGLKQTPSQTIGPFFAYGLTPEQYGYAFRGIAGPSLVTAESEGRPIRVEGLVFDGENAPVSDAMIEIWQADAQGRYAHPADPRHSNATFRGFGRCGTGTDPQSRFSFETIKPGPVAAGAAPHINLVVFMRGLLSHAYTRIYFSDEAEANAADPLLQQVEASRRATLIAEGSGGDLPCYRFDIHMQGPKETVFFDV